LQNSANLRAIPFEKGNRLAERHGFYATVLSPIESAEIAEIADAIRELSPLDAEGSRHDLMMTRERAAAGRLVTMPLERNLQAPERGLPAWSGRRFLPSFHVLTRGVHRRMSRRTSR
jgi:hypothetical protein